MKDICILQLSDLHANENSSELSQYTQKIIADLDNLKTKYDLNIDFITFCGDLIQNGANFDAQFQCAYDYFMTPILKKLSLDENSIFFVPGNHEIDLTQKDSIMEKGMEQELSCIQNLKKVLQSKSTIDYIKRLCPCFEYELFFNNQFLYKSEFARSFIIEKDDIKIGICCFNTTWNSSGDSKKDKGTLIFGYPEAVEAFRSISSCKFKIALMHHPVSWISDLESQNFNEILSNFDIVLSGHLHDLNERQIISANKSTLYLSSGRLDSTEHDYNGYSIIKFNPLSKEIMVYFRKYYHKRNEFDAALEICSDGICSYQLGNPDATDILVFNLVKKTQDYFKNKLSDSLIANMIKGKTFSIENAFVKPILRNSSELNKEYNSEDKKAKKLIDFDEIINEKCSIIFYGRRESGKSTLLNYIAWNYYKKFNNLQKIPFVVDLKYLNLAGKNHIVRAIKKSISDLTDNEVAISTEDLEHVLLSGMCVMLFDNFDYMNDQIVDIITNFCKTYSNIKCYFTCEENYFSQLNSLKSKIGEKEIRNIYIHSLTKQSIRKLTQQWMATNRDSINDFTNKISRYFDVTGMPKTPFNAIIILSICESDYNFVPINESNVMQRFMEEILEKLNISDLKIESYDFNNKESFLAYLSKFMLEKNKFSISQSEFDYCLQSFFAENGLDLEKSGFRTIFFDKKVLVKNFDNISFNYQCMIEYYLAKAMADDENFQNEIMVNHDFLDFVQELNYLSGIKRNNIFVINIVKQNLIKYIDKYSDKKIDIEDYKISFNNPFITDKITDDIKIQTETLDSYTNTPDQSVNYEPTKMSKKSMIKTNEFASFLKTVDLFGKLVRNCEYLSPVIKEENIKLCSTSFCIILGLLDDVIKEIMDYTLYDIAEVDKIEDVDEKKEIFDTLQDIINVLRISLPVAIQSAFSQTFGSPKLVNIYDKLFNDSSSNSLSKFLLTFTILDLHTQSGFTNVKTLITETSNDNMLDFIYIKLLFYFTTSYLNKRYDITLKEMIADIAEKKGKYKLGRQKGMVIPRNEVVKELDKMGKGRIQNAI